MIVLILLGLMIVSFLWAVVALRKEEKSHAKITHARNELQKEKILFKN